MVRHVNSSRAGPSFQSLHLVAYTILSISIISCLAPLYIMRSHISNQEWKLQPTALGRPRCIYTLGPMNLDGRPSAPGGRRMRIGL